MLVEPNVPMDSLVSATLPLGLVPPLVIEFPGINAGAGFSRTFWREYLFSIWLLQSYCCTHRDGACDWKDCLCVNIDKSDLFRGAAASFRTLGVITLLEVQLIETHSYVELTYH